MTYYSDYESHRGPGYRYHKGCPINNMLITGIVVLVLVFLIFVNVLFVPYIFKAVTGGQSSKQEVISERDIDAEVDELEQLLNSKHK